MEYNYTNDYHYNRLLEQTIDILIYDYKNKYETLKMNGLTIGNIDKCMDEYQISRTKSFVNDIKRIHNIYKNWFICKWF